MMFASSTRLFYVLQMASRVASKVSKTLLESKQACRRCQTCSIRFNSSDRACRRTGLILEGRTCLDHRCQFGKQRAVQPVGPVCGPVVLQVLRSRGIEAVDLSAQGLPVHSPDPNRLGAAHLIQPRCQ
jgi:hypothetical protein